ncbi:MAG: phage Gp37/Gp68 family protein [Gammaproteobacteria bacterium]|nr:phage Gp37/Gp68 family protein [Gammaproteobacteria bacterium]
MSDQTNIEWADSTFNPWMGCTKVSPACDHCYAERDTKRFGRVEWGAGKPRVRTSAANWKLPERWEKQAFWFRSCSHCGWRGELPSGGACGVCPRCGWAAATNPSRRRVFCASLADWLDNEVPIEWLVDLLDLIRRTPNLDWLLLTKRIGIWRGRLQSVLDFRPGSGAGALAFNWLDGRPPANVWLGATVINQAEADRDVPKLLAVPARVRFLSIEPMLGDIRLGSWLQLSPSAAFLAGKVTQEMPAWTRIGSTRLDWIIAGGESGPHARPMHPDWGRSLRDQCAAAGVPFLFKQWGEWAPVDPCMPSELQESEELAGKLVDGMHRVGKKAAGRKLDGRTHDGSSAAQP